MKDTDEDVVLSVALDAGATDVQVDAEDATAGACDGGDGGGVETVSVSFLHCCCCRAQICITQTIELSCVCVYGCSHFFRVRIRGFTCVPWMLLFIGVCAHVHLYTRVMCTHACG